MTDLLPLDPDQLLTTTRSVRKRLDYDRPVPLEVVKEALEVALQAPTGSNSQTWHWIVVTEPELKQKIADYYAQSFAKYYAGQKFRDETGRRVASSAQYLADTMGQVPVLVIGAIFTGGELPAGNQAGVWGSLLPAAWSLQLALRARGLGSAWTTLHLAYEKEVAELLGIPRDKGIHQGVLLPVAYTKGTDFKPAPRKPLDSVLHVNGW
ncbi:nitroreductase family protein [Gordonia paraffinivorans]|uniref:Oxidoreductase n=2 Tax=Gordonia paraffinivorans TaxID=175628 RepID=A0ABQ0IG92_9ACTN|nr:nitroreductase family protein [Gordonia paraffinivorans]MBY4575189.1 nitroreductase [Gordonia paraffinivorans]MCD2146340.1 nitroreductase family protein [Gordonia paraffinivorans]PWD44837.1 nitroreductase [Gordonia paraffinivorans]VFA90047.1 F420-0--gamma-glutamyl ligase [Gordonia paraffinivorans]GAC82617.1 putative oxidoreductase [Gordonia paraffinivorans NBRC 108238]